MYSIDFIFTINSAFKLVVLLKNGILGDSKDDINVKKIYLKNFKIGQYVFILTHLYRQKSQEMEHKNESCVNDHHRQTDHLQFKTDIKLREVKRDKQT